MAGEEGGDDGDEEGGELPLVPLRDTPDHPGQREFGVCGPQEYSKIADLLDVDASLSSTPVSQSVSQLVSQSHLGQRGAPASPPSWIGFIL